MAWEATGRPNPAKDTPEGRGERLAKAIAERTGDEGIAAEINTATSFGIRRVLLNNMRHDRVLFIGDTAHEVSPIGGQGLNLGVLDAVSLAPVLEMWLREQNPAPLERWEAGRMRAARAAARIASINTVLGRERASAPTRMLARTVAGMLHTPAAASLARAYTMERERHLNCFPEVRG